MNIKGSQFINLLETIRKNRGEEGYQQLLDSLCEESRSFLQNETMFASNWYSFDTYMEVLKADFAMFHNGNTKSLISAAEENIEKQLKGMYRIFVRLSSPAHVVQKVDDINRAFFQGVSGTSVLVEPNKFVSQFVGFKPSHFVFENIIIAFFNKMLTLCGARNVRAVFTVPMAVGGPFAEVTVTWN